MRAEGKVGHKLALQRTEKKSAPVAAAAAENPGMAEGPPFQVSAQCQEENIDCILALLELSPGRSKSRGLYLGTGRKS